MGYLFYPQRSGKKSLETWLTCYLSLGLYIEEVIEVIPTFYLLLPSSATDLFQDSRIPSPGTQTSLPSLSAARSSLASQWQLYEIFFVTTSKKGTGISKHFLRGRLWTMRMQNPSHSTILPQIYPRNISDYAKHRRILFLGFKLLKKKKKDS